MLLIDNANSVPRARVHYGTTGGIDIRNQVRKVATAVTWRTVTIFALALILAPVASAQTTRLPSGAAVPLSQSMVPRSGSPVDIPQTNLTPIGQPGFSAPPTSATLGNPVFDPYSTGANAGSYQPAFPPGALPPPQTNYGTNGGLLGGLFSQPASAPTGLGPYSGYPAPSYGQPSYGQPSYVPPPSYNAPPNYGAPPPTYAAPPGATPWQSSPYGSPPAFSTPGAAPPGLGAPTYPSTIYPSGSPTTLFPGGLFGTSGFGAGGGGDGLSAYRLLQGPRVRHTFINGGDGASDLQINDTDASIAFAFPNFLYSNQPIYVVPSFSLHLWDGPLSSSGADLPGQAFDGFLDVGWQTDPNQILGVQLGVRVGVFSDFDSVGSDSFRTLGKGILTFRLTPAVTIKGGVYYIDREERDFIPAFGVLYQPDPFTRLDLYFPEPKLSRYWRTVGTYDVWGYVAGEYGGGVWTIKRASGASDTVDMYDYKVFLGLEWGESNAIRVGRRSVFTEIGYVFNRKLKYKSAPSSTFDLDEGFFIRAGIGY